MIKMVLDVSSKTIAVRKQWNDFKELKRGEGKSLNSTPNENILEK